MLKKFNKFIIENVEVLDPTTTTTIQKPKSGDERYIMLFIVRDNKIVTINTHLERIHDEGGDILLIDEEYMNSKEHHGVSRMYLCANFSDSTEVYKVEMQKQFVDAARKQTGLELKIGEIYRLQEDQRLYTWLLENIDII